MTLLSCSLSRAAKWEFIIKGRVKMGCLVHRKTCTIVTFTLVNLEDKEALAQLVEAVRTSYNIRYDEIHHHGEVTSEFQKIGALMAKLEMQRLKILSPNCDKVQH